MRAIKLNTPSRSNPLSLKELDVRVFTHTFQYIDKGLVLEASTEKPIYRLAKDYVKDGKRFALNLAITDKNVKKAEKFMDKIADTVKHKPTRSFEYIQQEYKP